MILDIANLATEVSARMKHTARRPFLVGITGAPGSGKSTLSELLTDKIAELGTLRATYCSIDGFLFSNQRLTSAGLDRFKGRPDTYDTDALFAACVRLRLGDNGFFWPVYSRVLHEPIPDGIFIAPDVDVVILEGNYILNQCDQWRPVFDLLDFKVYLQCLEPILRERLLQRHLASGRTVAAALQKIEETDLPNARLIAASADYADAIFDSV